MQAPTDNNKAKTTKGKDAARKSPPRGPPGFSHSSHGTGLTCQKCCEPTTMAKSCAAGGRNQLIRVCLPCVATDKAFLRDTAKEKRSIDSLEDGEDKAARLKQEEMRVKAHKAMKPLAKKDWLSPHPRTRCTAHTLFLECVSVDSTCPLRRSANKP